MQGAAGQQSLNKISRRSVIKLWNSQLHKESTVEPHYFELGYFGHPAISNSNPFPFKCFFSSFTIIYFKPQIFQAVFHFPWGFEIAGFNCTCTCMWSPSLPWYKIVSEYNCSNVVFALKIIMSQTNLIPRVSFSTDQQQGGVMTLGTWLLWNSYSYSYSVDQHSHM